MMLENSVATIISLSCPLILMVIGETISERVGVINLSMEGSVMLAAMLGFAVAVITGSVLLGFICALLCGSTISAIIALFDVKFGMNQIVVGFILSMICINLSNFLGQSYVNIPGPRIPSINFGIMNEIPFLGKIIFSQNILVIFSFLSVFISWLFLFRTSAGLLLRSIGENPEAAKMRGVNVNFYRFLYVTVGGAFIGLGGAAFSLHAKYGWSDSHTANFGWIALAIVIFEVALNAFSLFNHANIRLPEAWDKRVSTILVTQRLHRIHHSQAKQYSNTNYGFSVTWWDKLFNSFTSQSRVDDATFEIGQKDIPAVKENASVLALLKQPFNHKPEGQ